jgi:NAD(P)-dependent dehydrogenase (short-subunit alcohol dehydrogenase family)
VNGAPRTAVVTGAASGIGRACAERLKLEGFDVLAVDRDSERLGELERRGFRTLVGDLAVAERREAVVAAGAGASALVNAAGVMVLKPILEVGPADIRSIYAVNVEAVWDLTSGIGRTMPEGSAIVNLGSSAAKHSPMAEAAVYASSKAAVLSITRSFASAFAPRVRVNAICPGAIDTPMRTASLSVDAGRRGISIEELSAERAARIPMGRAASADECAGVIWFLLSDAAAFMTGQSINYTGGLITW